MRASPWWSPRHRVSEIGISFNSLSFSLTHTVCLAASARAAAAGGAGNAEEAAGTGGRKKKVNLVATPLKEDNNAQPITLEAWQEAQEREDADVLETRKCPEYTMTYRQAVGTEDVFLQVRQHSPPLQLTPVQLIHPFSQPRWVNAQAPLRAVRILCWRSHCLARPWRWIR